MAKETIVEESQDFKDDFFKQLKNSVIPTEPEMGAGKTDKLADLLSRKELHQCDWKLLLHNHYSLIHSIQLPNLHSCHW